MRILLIIALFFSISGYTQPTGPVGWARVQDTAELRTSFKGGESMVVVLSDNLLYRLCYTCVVDGNSVLQGAGWRKWQKVATEADSLALAKTITLIAGANVSIIGNPTQSLGSNPAWTISSPPDFRTTTQLTDTSFLLNRPDGTADTVVISGLTGGGAGNANNYGYMNGLRLDSTWVKLGGLISEATSLTWGAEGVIYIGDGATAYDNTIELGNGYEIHYYSNATRSVWSEAYPGRWWADVGENSTIGARFDLSAQNGLSLAKVIANRIQLLQSGGTLPVPEYADNTAAKAAGLANGTVYRTGEFLKIVY